MDQRDLSVCYTRDGRAVDVEGYGF